MTLYSPETLILVSNLIFHIVYQEGGDGMLCLVGWLAGWFVGWLVGLVCEAGGEILAAIEILLEKAVWKYIHECFK